MDDIEDDYTISTDQRDAVMELENLAVASTPRRDRELMWRPDDDGGEDVDEDDDDDEEYFYLDDPSYDIAARLKEVNKAFQEDTTPVDSARVRRVVFSEKLVEFPAAQLDYASDVDDGYGDSPDALFGDEDYTARRLKVAADEQESESLADEQPGEVEEITETQREDEHTGHETDITRNEYNENTARQDGDLACDVQARESERTVFAAPGRPPRDAEETDEDGSHSDSSGIDTIDSVETAGEQLHQKLPLMAASPDSDQTANEHQTDQSEFYYETDEHQTADAVSKLSPERQDGGTGDDSPSSELETSSTVSSGRPPVSGASKSDDTAAVSAEDSGYQQGTEFSDLEELGNKRRSKQTKAKGAHVISVEEMECHDAEETAVAAECKQKLVNREKQTPLLIRQSSDGDAAEAGLVVQDVLIEANRKFELICVSDLQQRSRRPGKRAGPASSQETKDRLSNQEKKKGSCDFVMRRGKSSDNVLSETRSRTVVRARSKNSAAETLLMENSRPQTSMARLSANNGSVAKWALPRYNGARSLYGLSADQLEERRRLFKTQVEEKRNNRERDKEENERKKRENEDIFQAWLETKKKNGMLTLKKQEEKRDTEGNLQQKKKEASAAFQAWLDKKKEQTKLEKRMREIQRKQEESMRYRKAREDCERAYKDWIKKKASEATAAHSQRRQKKNCISRRTQSLDRPTQKNSPLWKTYQAYVGTIC